uniref:DNA-directed RNA polymerase n=1 Tax=Dichotomosiphon tuberosus TaxID=118263 RepID=A0A386AWN0_9CHLO|nr:RNA polymerase b-subunit [Dichotomosiphon tuberosus]
MLNENITFNKKIIFFNKCFDKKQLKLLIYWFLTHLDESKTLKFIENLKELGFKYATKIGISISIDDLKIPFLKYKSIYTNEKETLNLELNLDAGYITKVEKVKRFIELWHRLSENLKNEVVQYFQITDIFNPVYMMLFSGARGNISQIRQLIAMRGLMSDPQGEIIDFPIRSNFREGLTLTEYIISCYGARKGIVDTALRTAKSGYLTRRLVDIAHHVIICKQDCKTNRGIWIKDLYDKNKIVLKLKDRIIGRVLAENIVYENSDLLIGLKNQEISFILADKLLNNIDYLKKKIFIRSPLTCLSPHAICQLCYGWNLAANKLVSLGEAVGVLAAQSIGEPGTQLTMRTFHTGGVFSGTLIDQLTSPFKGQIFFPEHCDGLLVRTLQAKIGFLTKRQGILKIKSYNTEDIKKFNFIFPIHTLLFVKNKEFVNKMQVIAELPGLISKSFENEKQIKNKFSGQLYFENLSLIEKIKNENNIKFFVKDLGSIWVLMGVYFKALFSSETFFHKRDLINSKVLCQKFNIRNNGFSVIDSIDLESNQNIKILINKYFKIKDNIKNNIKEILFLKPYISFYLFNIFLFKKIGYFNYLKINSIKKYFLWNILSIKNDIFYYWYYKIYNKDSKNNILSWTSGIKFFKIKNKVWFRFLNDYKLNINNSLYNSFQIINKNLFNFTIINHKNLINKLTCNFSNKNYFIISKNRQGFNQINELKYIFLFYTKTIKPNNKIFKISKNKFNLSYLDIKLNKTFNYSIFSFFKNFFFSKLISFNYDVKLYYKSYKFNNKKLLIFNWKNFIFKKINFKFLKFYKFIFLKYYFLNTNNFKYNKLKTNQIKKNFIRINSI